MQRERRLVSRRDQRRHRPRGRPRQARPRAPIARFAQPADPITKRARAQAMRRAVPRLRLTATAPRRYVRAPLRGARCPLAIHLGPTGVKMAAVLPSPREADRWGGRTLTDRRLHSSYRA